MNEKSKMNKEVQRVYSQNMFGKQEEQIMGAVFTEL